jgi:phenylacetate-CoA ligase
LRALLAHAEAHVPYYRNLFRSLGTSTQEIRNWDDFAQLPILTKDIIREKQRDLVREDVPIEKLKAHFSGGSTGVPLKFFRSIDYMAASDAGTYRNLQQCGWHPGEMIAFFWGGNNKLYAMSRAEFELRQFMRRTYQFDPFHSGEAEMADWANRFARVRPRVILGYASTIARFAEFLDRQRKSNSQINERIVDRIKGVFTTAEKLYQPQREVIERVFGCKVFDCYGSSEVQNIAAECPAGKMHINADFVVLEEDKNEDKALDRGPRPFLLTSLRNWSMPFIRYRNDDGGYLLQESSQGVSQETCSCGNHFPLMRLEIARTSDNFVMPDGCVVHGEFFTHLMYGSDGILTFQFHQTATDEIILSIVPGPGDSKARQQKIQDSIRQIQALCPNHAIRVEIREVAAIPLSSAGKYRFTRSDVSTMGTTVPGETVPASRT